MVSLNHGKFQVSILIIDSYDFFLFLCQCAVRCFVVALWPYGVGNLSSSFRRLAVFAILCQISLSGGRTFLRRWGRFLLGQGVLALVTSERKFYPGCFTADFAGGDKEVFL